LHKEVQGDNTRRNASSRVTLTEQPEAILTYSIGDWGLKEGGEDRGKRVTKMEGL